MGTGCNFFALRVITEQPTRPVAVNNIALKQKVVCAFAEDIAKNAKMNNATITSDLKFFMLFAAILINY